MLTYRDLLISLRNLTNEQLDNSVTLYNKVEDEYSGIIELRFSDDECDVVDPGHLLLVYEECPTSVS